MSFQETPYSSSYSHYLVWVGSEKSCGNFKDKRPFYYIVKSPYIHFKTSFYIFIELEKVKWNKIKISLLYF